MSEQPAFDLVVVNPKEIGHANAHFLGDLANGATADELRTNWKAGRYPGLCPDFAKANLAWWGKA